MNIAIVGAGACGLLLALKLNQVGIFPTIYNKGKVARKILASGNGRCNISNNNPRVEDYFNNSLAYNIVNSNKDELFRLFDELGIYLYEKEEGRLYPYSESSQSVVNILLKNIKSEIVDLEIAKIKYQDSKYYLNDLDIAYDYVVISTGSKAGFRKNLEPNEFYRGLNIKVNEFKPTLVGFRTSYNIKKMSGARSKARVSLYNNNSLVYSESGEIIFKDDGISGICIMNISSIYQRIAKNKPYLKIDLAEGLNYSNYESILTPKIYEYVIANNIDPHNLVLNIIGTYDFEFAQVATGGIDLGELNNDLSFKKYKNLYAGGEVIDADAKCGGYNLMLAFCSSLCIYKELINEISNK